MSVASPAPPEAITGTVTASQMVRSSSRSYPPPVPSASMLVTSSSPAPSAAASAAHSIALRPVGRLPGRGKGLPPLAVPCGVDRHHDALAAELVGELADELRAIEWGGVGADLVGSGEQQVARIADRADAAADTQRDVDLLGRPLDGLQQLRPLLVSGRDVQPHDLVGALLRVAAGRVDRIAAVAERLEVDALHEPPAAHVEAGDDPPTQRHRAPTPRGLRARPARSSPGGTARR